MTPDGATSTSRRSRAGGRVQTPGTFPEECYTASAESPRRMAASPLSASLQGCGTPCSTQRTARTARPRRPCTRNRHRSSPTNPRRCPHAVLGQGWRTRCAHWGRAMWPTLSRTARPPCRTEPGRRRGAGTPYVDRPRTARARTGPGVVWNGIPSFPWEGVTGPNRAIPPNQLSPSRAGSGPSSHSRLSPPSCTDQVSESRIARAWVRGQFRECTGDSHLQSFQILPVKIRKHTRLHCNTNPCPFLSFNYTSGPVYSFL